MSTKLEFLHDFLTRIFATEAKNPKGGKPFTHSKASFVLFFVIMFYKRIYAFRTMEKYCVIHFKEFGFREAPCRRTIKRRFVALPTILQFLIPQIAQYCKSLDFSTFGFSFAFVDKSVFRALGGLWHKKDMLINRIPHPSIDTDASWSKSAYHGWRFGYGLHLICNQLRFPISACVTTACVKDHTVLEALIAPVSQCIGIIVGDKGYFALRSLQKIYQRWQILIQTPDVFENVSQKPKDWFKRIYNRLVQTTQAGWLYKKRKPSIEPHFSLIKELFELQGNKQLPFQKLKYIRPFLLLTVLTMQLMMYDNFVNNRELGKTDDFLTFLR